jgi:hypothetical protein
MKFEKVGARFSLGRYFQHHFVQKRRKAQTFEILSKALKTPSDSRLIDPVKVCAWLTDKRPLGSGKRFQSSAEAARLDGVPGHG